MIRFSNTELITATPIYSIKDLVLGQNIRYGIYRDINGDICPIIIIKTDDSQNRNGIISTLFDGRLVLDTDPLRNSQWCENPRWVYDGDIVITRCPKDKLSGG